MCQVNRFTLFRSSKVHKLTGNLIVRAQGDIDKKAIMTVLTHLAHYFRQSGPYLSPPVWVFRGTLWKELRLGQAFGGESNIIIIQKVRVVVYDKRAFQVNCKPEGLRCFPASKLQCFFPANCGIAARTDNRT